MSLIALTAAPFGSHVVVDAHAVEHAVAHPPEDPEPVPLAVRRHVRVEPPQAGLDRVVVVVGRPEPRWRALEHEQLADLGRDLGDELHRARAGADHGDALAAEIDVVVPPRRVERRTRERVAPGDVGERRPVELADRADDRVRLDRLVGDRRACATSTVQTRVLRRTTSPTRTSVPNRMCVAQVERVGAAAEVVEQHVLRREVQRPVVALRERVAVVVVRVVDAATRIRVLEPRAADVVVLLDDDEVDARLLQAVRGEQARHARADDDDVEVDVGRDVALVPAGRAPVLAAVRRAPLRAAAGTSPSRRRRPRTP